MWGHPNLGGSHLQILTELHLHQPRVQRNSPSEGPREPTLAGDGIRLATNTVNCWPSSRHPRGPYPGAVFSPCALESELAGGGAQDMLMLLVQGTHFGTTHGPRAHQLTGAVTWGQPDDTHGAARTRNGGASPGGCPTGSVGCSLAWCAPQGSVGCSLTWCAPQGSVGCSLAWCVVEQVPLRASLSRPGLTAVK